MNIDIGIAGPLPAECQNILEIVGPYLVFCLIQHVLQYVPVPCGPLAPPPANASLIGCPGNPAQVAGAQYTGGPGASGHTGGNGQAGGVGNWSVSVSYPLGIGLSGSVSCNGPNTPAGDGQSPNQMPTDGNHSWARGGNGTYGVILGGSGGNAFVQGAAGGLGMSGGEGGAGDHWENEFCHQYVRPGNGGMGQTGGKSGPGDAWGGLGGNSAIQGGRGGDATTQYGDPGSGGNGGNAGSVAWGDSAVQNFCTPASPTPVDHGVPPATCVEYGCGGLSNGCVSLTYVGRGDQGCRGLAGSTQGVTPHKGLGGLNALSIPGPPGTENGPLPPNQPGTNGVNGTGDPHPCP
jgi:hypothetical protein